MLKDARTSIKTRSLTTARSTLHAEEKKQGGGEEGRRRRSREEKKKGGGEEGRRRSRGVWEKEE